MFLLQRFFLSINFSQKVEKGPGPKNDARFWRFHVEYIMIVPTSPYCNVVILTKDSSRYMKCTPTHIAVNISFPFGKKTWKTYAKIEELLLDIQQLINKMSVIHTIYMADDMVGCEIHYTGAGIFGHVKVFSINSESDYVLAKFFTERYDHEIGNMLTCCIYEIEGSTRWLPSELIERAFTWYRSIFPCCSVHDSCTLINLTRNTLTSICHVLCE